MKFFNLIIGILPWLIFIQGVLLAVVLSFKRRYPGNIYLAVLILLLSVHGLTSAIWTFQNQGYLLEIFVALSCLPFVYGPLLYRYVWHSMYKDFHDPVPLWLHVAPAAINLAFYVGLYITIGQEQFYSITFEVLENGGPVYVRLIEGLKGLQGMVYTVLVMRLYYKHWNALSKWSAVSTRRNWHLSLITLYLVNWILAVTGILLAPIASSLIMTGVQLIAFLSFLYTVTFFAMRYPIILEYKEVREEIRKKLNLNEGFISETRKRLVRAESEKFFTDPDITLPLLATKIGLHANALSFILNDQKKMSFRDYVNALRVEEFLRLSKEANGLNQLDRALAAGFSSKSTFLRAFRKIHNTTPRDYLAS